jgi:lipid II:glycine glycyltransferase (peptidoglycan interpeptide bridge formation enzyme)
MLLAQTGYTLTRVSDRASERQYSAFLAAQPAGDFLQTLAWGRVKSGTGWRSLPVLLRDAGGQPVLSALILRRKLPGLPLALYYAPRGPVVDWNLPPDQLSEILHQFSAQIKALARADRAVLLKVDPALPADNQSGQAALERGGFRVASAGLSFEAVQPRFVYAIDITPSAEELLASFTPKHRYNIRLAGRKGVTIRQATEPADMAEFYRILRITAERDRFGVRAYSYYQAIWDEIVEPTRIAETAPATTPSSGGYLFLAEHAGQAYSGALILTLGRHAWYVYGASDNQGRNLMPNYALHWEIMLFLKQRGFAVYDMRGISGDMSPDNPLYGLFRFKKGFAGQVIEYAGEMDLPLAGPLYSAVKIAMPAYRRLQKMRRGGARGHDAPGDAPETDPAASDSV